MTRSRDIHQAVDQLIDRRRVQIARDDGTYAWTTTPSLWELLTAGASDANGNTTGGNTSRRLPVSATIIDLSNSITAKVTRAAAELKVKRNTVPNTLRAIAAAVESDSHEAWADLVERWCSDIRAALHLNP